MWLFNRSTLFVLLLVATGAFIAGWKVKSAFVAERDLAINEAKQALITEYRDNEAGKAAILEQKLASLRANEKVINHEIVKIIDRPVYTNICLDSDGLRLIEAARVGKTDTTESAQSVPSTK